MQSSLIDVAQYTVTQSWSQKVLIILSEIFEHSVQTFKK